MEEKNGINPRMWVARDSCCGWGLRLFREKPEKGENDWESELPEWCDDHDAGFLILPESFFPEVKWEDDEPLEVELKIGSSDYLWLNRYSFGGLLLCSEKCVKEGDDWSGLCECDWTELPPFMFPDVKWEDAEPTGVELVIKK